MFICSIFGHLIPYWITALTLCQLLILWLCLSIDCNCLHPFIASQPNHYSFIIIEARHVHFTKDVVNTWKCVLFVWLLKMHFVYYAEHHIHMMTRLYALMLVYINVVSKNRSNYNQVWVTSLDVGFKKVQAHSIGFSGFVQFVCSMGFTNSFSFCRNLSI